MSTTQDHDHDHASGNDADADTGSQGPFANSVATATLAGTEQAIRSGDGVIDEHCNNVDQDGDEIIGDAGTQGNDNDNDDDSYGTIKTTKSLKESKVANTKVEVQFGESSTHFSFTNTSMVALPSSNKKPPRVASASSAASMEHLRATSESGFLSALTEEQTIDSVGAVGTQNEDDLYSIATERSFTGAMINLVIREPDASVSVTGQESVTGGVDDSMAALEETREEDCDDQFSVMTTEVNEEM